MNITYMRSCLPFFQRPSSIRKCYNRNTIMLQYNRAFIMKYSTHYMLMRKERKCTKKGGYLICWHPFTIRGLNSHNLSVTILNPKAFTELCNSELNNYNLCFVLCLPSTLETLFVFKLVCLNI